MDWATAVKLPWGVLMLFGGGLTLAASIEANGVSAFIGNASRGFAGLPPVVLLLAITTMTVLLSELTSNTAQVTTMLPLLAAMGPQLGIDPYALVIACTLGASSAYMMPVGTPPNAIVFGTGLVRMPQMMKARHLAQPLRHSGHHRAGGAAIVSPRRESDSLCRPKSQRQ